MNLNLKIEELLISTRTKNALIDSGIELLAQLTEKTSEDLKLIDGLGTKGQAEIKLVLQSKGLKLKPKPKAKKEDFEFKKMIISKFLKNIETLDWGKEMRVASTILKKYPDKEFWRYFTLSYKLNSLFYFFSENGKKVLLENYGKKFLKTEKRDFNISSEKIGEDRILEKPKSIRDFLNGF